MVTFESCQNNQRTGFKLKNSQKPLEREVVQSVGQYQARSRPVGRSGTNAIKCSRRFSPYLLMSEPTTQASYFTQNIHCIFQCTSSLGSVHCICDHALRSQSPCISFYKIESLGNAHRDDIMLSTVTSFCTCHLRQSVSPPSQMTETWITNISPFIIFQTRQAQLLEVSSPQPGSRGLLCVSCLSKYQAGHLSVSTALVHGLVLVCLLKTLGPEVKLLKRRMEVLNETQRGVKGFLPELVVIYQRH